MDSTNANALASARGAGPRAYAEAALMVAGSTLLGLAIAPRWGTSPVDLLYLPAVLGAAVLGGLRPALFAALASTLAFNFFFTVPLHSFRIDRPTDVVTVVLLFVVAVVTSQLAASVRRQAQIAAAHAARNASIAGLARRLLSCTSERDIADVATAEIGGLFGCNAMMVGGAPEPQLIASAPADARLTPSDVAAAALTLADGIPAGRGVSRVDPANWQFHPIRADADVVAALGLARDDGAPPVAAEQLPLLENLLDQIALALERTRLESEARNLAALRERDRTRISLLATIGQDVSPRLATISSTVDALRRSGSGDRELLSAVAAETVKLDRYIANLVEVGPDADRRPLETGGIAIDLFRRQVVRHGENVHLTPKEYAVLAELAKHPGRVLAHAHLLRAAWGPAHEGQTDYLRIAVRALRQKLEADPAHPQLILNEPAVGYRLAIV